LREKLQTLENHPERCALAAEAAAQGIELREELFGRRRGLYRDPEIRFLTPVLHLS
jgi:hypothetical protein